ncbi:hypothetical protein [uncultured Enterovirga sp.]|uniref:hypothetical protein n=1 Tax=uncultured Enterovirga sp. TaxID=2026352 RepID=UPI0035CA99BE
MNFSVVDASGLLIAALLYVPLLVLPGFAIAASLNLLGFRDLSVTRRWGVAILTGFSLLPWLGATLIRFAGSPAALAVTAGLALVGAAQVVRQRCLPGWGWKGEGWTALWILIVVVVWIDVDAGGGLRQPILIIDLVKHAATTWALAETGAPPIDPFFAREGRVGYYYFFYTLTALADVVGRPLVDPRAAFGGLVVWTGFGLFALLDRLLDRSGFVRGLDPLLVRRCCLALLPAAGLDIVPVGWSGMTTGVWMPILEWWNDQVCWWLTSLIWVPHHVAGLLAAWFGFLVLADEAEGQGKPDVWRLSLAGVAFASCAGLSVWVSVGAVATAGVWMLWLGLERRWRPALLLGAAGVVSLILAAPHLADIAANRMDARIGVGFSIRRFGPLESLHLDPVSSALARFVVLPFNYYIGFGVFASGSLLYWRMAGRTGAQGNDVARLLAASAGASLLVGGFFASTILANDLGWRVVLFAQAAAFCWTVAAVARWISERRAAGQPRARAPAFIVALALVGYAGSLHTLVWQRAYPWSGFPDTAFMNARPDIDRALRVAYGWANERLPAAFVLQHNPAPGRVFDFGLYSRHRVGVADREAQLFGAHPDAVRERIDALLPVFLVSEPAASVRERARKAGIDMLVVTAADPVWQDRTSWLWNAKAAYEDPLVRMVRVGDL